MISRVAISILVLAILASPVLAGHHSWGGHSHGSGGSGDSSTPPDPHIDAFITTMFFGLLAVCFLFIGIGPILVIWGPRPRHTLWIIPLGNLLLYLLNIALTPYPDGFLARLRSPGLGYTIAEALILLILSGIIALIIALIQWVVRKSWAYFKKPEQPATAEVVP